MSRLGSLATRLYRGQAGINVVGRRRVWFGVAAAVLLAAALSVALRGFSFGIEFRGGNEFHVPASVGTIAEVEAATAEALEGRGSGGEPARLVSAQELRQLTGGDGADYLLRTTELTDTETLEVKQELADRFGIPAEQIGDSRVSSAWGGQVTRQALIGLVVFVALVTVYLIIRFELRMALAAISSLLLDLVTTGGVYSLVGFEVTPSTVIGFLTILGFALYDVVVVFDKVQENTRSITASSTTTYADAANLAVNQTLMRSINTGLVALLPVGGLLFIGAGMLGAGTLKDLGLVLFVGMGAAVYSSIFFATPVLVTLKEREPRIRMHTQRVLARRAAGGAPARAGRTATRTPARTAAAATAADSGTDSAPGPDALADRASFAAASARAAGPRPGAKPAKRSGGKRPSRGGRPSGGKRR
ncbi:MAG: protein translocase subunit SecF [Micromonosporaceae bacterium]